ncbi:hypothetical protein SEA_BEUFFERT_199 [Streptomyces phage Beuffert]|nr:hypothetical protein SEA_BEUFFERT_199 [Streptomyces phage Beuffert]
MLTRREAAIITAYTGIALGNFGDAHLYMEEVVGHPIWTHELANPKMWEKIKEASRPDFLALEIEGLDENGQVVEKPPFPGKQ